MLLFRYLLLKGNPGVSACGDDGDENAKAALYALKELDGGKPTVAFFITDAGYHRTKRESPTAQAEDDYLLGKGASDTDFYVLFDSVRTFFFLFVSSPREEDTFQYI